MKHYNASDPEQVKAQEKAAQLARDQYYKDLREVLALPSGIRVFSRLLEEGRMFSTSFTGNSTTFFNEGMRNLVLKIFADICEAAPDKVASLILRAKED